MAAQALCELKAMLPNQLPISRLLAGYLTKGVLKYLEHVRLFFWLQLASFPMEYLGS
jgi:hypothetical protein